MTARLLRLAQDNWSAYDGLLSSRGVDPLELPPDRFFSSLYEYATHNGDPDEIVKFDRRLWRPPKGVAPEAGTPWSPEKETEAFKELAAALGVMNP